MPNPKINKSLCPDFDYDCECGFYVCTECGYPYYPMEVMRHDDGSNEICHVCDFGDVVEYCLTIKV
jgi:hypothetical protein